MRLIDLEDVYLNHYDLLRETEDMDKNFLEYVVQSDDTLEGIALKYNVNPKAVLDWNSISEESVLTGVVRLMRYLSASSCDRSRCTFRWCRRRAIDAFWAAISSMR
jgi:LysM domain